MSQSDSEMGLRIPRTGDISETEAKLREFYRSGEPETTTNYLFPSFNRALILRNLGPKGIGLFLEERAHPGQLLILGEAISSCKCRGVDMAYPENSYLQAQMGQPSIRTSMPIPEKVHEHLMYGLAKTITKSDTNMLAQIKMLDSHQPLQNDETLDVMISKRRLLRARREFKLQDSEGHKLEILDLEEVRNIVSNNAMCDKVRSLSLNESRAHVVTNHLWGLWVIPSWINHSCTPNCHRMRIGDAMIIRAAIKIEAGDELTLPYFDIFHPVGLRTQSCGAFHFRCECPRCIFENSIASMTTVYNDLALSSLRVEIRIQEIWKSGPDQKFTEANTLLGQLTQQLVPIRVMIDKLKAKFLDFNIQNEHLSSSEYISQVASGAWLFWILASFIGDYIGAYSLCENGFLDSVDPSALYGQTVTWREGPTSKSVEATRTIRTVNTVESILEILEQIHPGNLLGQEFYSIVLKEYRRFVSYDLKENEAKNNSHLRSVESRALRFFAKYYGYAGTEILSLLLETKS